MKKWAIRFRVEVTEEERRALAHWYGRSGMATLKDCRAWIRDNGLMALRDDLVHDFQKAQEPEIEEPPDSPAPVTDRVELDGKPGTIETREESGGKEYVLVRLDHNHKTVWVPGESNRVRDLWEGP